MFDHYRFHVVKVRVDVRTQDSVQFDWKPILIAFGRLADVTECHLRERVLWRLKAPALTLPLTRPANSTSGSFITADISFIAKVPHVGVSNYLSCTGLQPEPRCSSAELFRSSASHLQIVSLFWYKSNESNNLHSTKIFLVMVAVALSLYKFRHQGLLFEGKF